MVPPKSDQDKLITYFRDFGNPLPLGHVDPRFGLVLAAENWNTPEAKEFIKKVFKIGMLEDGEKNE